MTGRLKKAERTPDKILVGANELAREVKRIFPRLASAGSYLAVLDNVNDKSKTWGLFTARNDFQKPVATISARSLNAMSANDLIAKKGTQVYQLSKVGSAFYRRLVAVDDPFQAQHQLRHSKALPTSAGHRHKVVVNDAETPLGWLRRRKGADGQPFLTPEQFEAGERLRADFTYAHLSAHVTSNWTAPITGTRRRTGEPGGIAAMADNVIAAKKRFHSALNQVGPELSDVLVHVCCHLNGLEDAEKAHNWPKRSGKVVLRIALENLARYYGLVQNRHPNSPGRQGAQYWGADGYKPSIDG